MARADRCKPYSWAVRSPKEGAVETIVDVLGWLNLALLTLAAAISLRLWRAQSGRAGLWAALAFVSLAAVVDLDALLPEDPSGFLEVLAQRLLIAVLVLFPYLLFRFTTAFERPTRRVEELLGLSTVVVLAWTFLVPEFPGPDEPRSVGVTAYVVAFVAHWTLLASVSTWRLWRAGRHQPGVARRRMRVLALAVVAVTAALFLAAAGPDEGSAVGLATTLLVTASAILFLLGLSPPAWLRFLWRRPEQRRVQSVTAELMGATTEQEVADQVLEPMANLVAARAVALYAADGRLVGAHGPVDEFAAVEPLRFPIPAGSLVVWPSPYAPYFGGDELRVLRALAGLTGLALDRSRLFEQEREARLVLERADELKSEFVALAAHELRNPVSSIYGLAETLYLRGPDLPEDRRRELRAAIRDQARRLTILVEQLLDLSRVDSQAVTLEPRAFLVRERIEELVEAVAGRDAELVEIAVDDGLEAVADTHAFDRVVSNLVANALKYGAPPVRVAAERHNGRFSLAVEDRGPGVAPEFVPRLFERFARSGHAQATVVGTGLGLAIARSYARASGGELRYVPVEPRGARFELVLPVHEPAGRHAVT
jgi:signal transduction histidine kinase